jgi:hypothetical protein
VSAQTLDFWAILDLRDTRRCEKGVEDIVKAFAE